MKFLEYILRKEGLENIKSRRNKRKQKGASLPNAKVFIYLILIVTMSDQRLGGIENREILLTATTNRKLRRVIIAIVPKRYGT